jgi:hypothetical protein
MEVGLLGGQTAPRLSRRDINRENRGNMTTSSATNSKHKRVSTRSCPSPRSMVNKDRKTGYDW